MKMSHQSSRYDLQASPDNLTYSSLENSMKKDDKLCIRDEF